MAPHAAWRVGLGLSGLGVGWNGRAMERSPLAMCRARMKPQRGLGEGGTLRATASPAPHGLPDGGGAEHTHCPEGDVEASGEFSPSCGRAMRLQGNSTALGIVWIGILALLAL